MQTVGFCTHFTETCEQAFDYALSLCQDKGRTLSICHWLESPYMMRRDEIYAGPDKKETVPVTEELLVAREHELREHYDHKLGDLLDVKFRLCEGDHQVELVRCLRRHDIDMVVMGYQSRHTGGRTQEEFARRLNYPMVIVGHEGEQSYLINQQAVAIVDELDLPNGQWRAID